jgi:hypothetical protein
VGVRSSCFSRIYGEEAACRHDLHVRLAEWKVSGSVRRKIDWVISAGRAAAVIEACHTLAVITLELVDS